MPVNRVLTHPDFAARNQWVLERLWGAQLPGAPGRWPQFKRFPRLQVLELTCDQTVSLTGAMVGLLGHGTTGIWLLAGPAVSIALYMRGMESCAELPAQRLSTHLKQYRSNF